MAGGDREEEDALVKGMQTSKDLRGHPPQSWNFKDRSQGPLRILLLHRQAAEARLGSVREM